jgi:hypothetical protein
LGAHHSRRCSTAAARTAATLVAMIDTVPDEARARAEAVVESLVESLRAITLPEGPNSAVTFQPVEDAP